jgi:hypothetical protein
MKMFSKHVTKLLSAYCQHELPTAEAQRVQEHLQGCIPCRKEYEEIKLGIQLAQQLQITPAPDSLWLGISKKLNAPTPQTAPLAMWKWVFAVGMILLFAGGGWYALQSSRTAQPQVAQDQRNDNPPTSPTVRDLTPSPTMSVAPLPPGNSNLMKKTASPAWEVAQVEGAPKVGNTRIQSKGKLAVGEWLETDNASKAQIKVAEIGYVDIDPNSRVRLVQTTETEHRINLAQGKLSAFIVAPPRLFVVDTPSATAVDLGCAYTLEVDEHGASLLHVTSGWVSLVLHGYEAIIPAGAMCATRKGVGVGTPYFADAPAAFKAALTKLDFDPNAAIPETVNILLVQARVEDTLTLWHLLGRKYKEETATIRGRVFDRLVELAPPPSGVTRSGVIKGDRKMLDQWWDESIR